MRVSRATIVCYGEGNCVCAGAGIDMRDCCTGSCEAVTENPGIACNRAVRIVRGRGVEIHIKRDVSCGRDHGKRRRGDLVLRRITPTTAAAAAP